MSEASAHYRNQSPDGPTLLRNNPRFANSQRSVLKGPL